MSGIEDSSVRPGEKRTRVYYAHAYSAWERGSNENANKLIRRFIPKDVSMDHHSEEDIARIERWINNYPRRFLGYQTALERRRQLLSIPSRRL